MIYKTLKYHLKAKGEQKCLLDLLCHISKNIYNASLYELRQSYFKEGKLYDYSLFINKMKNNENYEILHAYQSVSTTKNAYTNMVKFINNKLKLSKYLSKEAYYPLIINNVKIEKINDEKIQQLPISYILKSDNLFKKEYSDMLINKFIKESKLDKNYNIYLKVPQKIENKDIRQIRIVPNYNGYYYTVEFSYIENEKITKNEGEELMAIDLGINNLATCVTTENESFIIDGKSLKSRNRLYNKKMAYLQSKNKKTEYTNEMKKIIIHHSNYVNDYINKAAKQLIEKAKSLKVRKIVIGYNKGLKNNGIKNDILTKKEKKIINQNFTQVPLYKFKERIKLVSEKEGIECEEINESYTSLASFYDGDKCKCGERFSGKRIKRGLYTTKEGKLVNADVNAALNILSKSNSNNNKINYLRSRGLTIPKRIQVNL